MNVAKPTVWQWSELASACDAAAPQKDGPEVLRVVTDSRTATEGDLFVALPGDPGPRFHPSQRSSVDGHDYVADAMARGAAGALVHRAIEQNLPVLQVTDTYDALWSLGRAARARLTGDVIAITGSSGKTTAKHFLAHALNGYMPPGSFNNHIGVPLALANANCAADTAIFEVGTSFPGEIEPLARMVAPDVALLLNVGSAHLENFESRNHLKMEKVSIFNSLTDKINAISHDKLALDYGYQFGESSTAQARLLGVDGDRAEVSLFGERLIARVPLGGLHRATTMLACLLVAKVLERPLDGALNLSAEAIPEGRGSVTQHQGITIVDDAYNANPDSMTAALSAFLASEAEPEANNARDGARAIVLLGEMLELGEVSEEAHAHVADLAVRADVAIYVGTGFETAARAQGALWFEQASDEVIETLCETLVPGDRLFVKASNRVFWASGFLPQLTAQLTNRK